MHFTFWVLAAVTILINIPSIVRYGIPEVKRAGNDRARAAAAFYVIARSAAIVTGVAAAIVAEYLEWGTGWLVAVAIVTAAVQAFDVPGALYGKTPLIAAGAAVLFAVEVAAIAVYVAWGR